MDCPFEVKPSSVMASEDFDIQVIVRTKAIRIIAMVANRVVDILAFDFRA